MARGRAGAGVATKRRAPRQAPVRWLAGALAGIVAWALAGPGHAGAAQSGYRQVRQFRAGLAHARGVAVGADGAIYLAGDRAVIRCGEEGRLQRRIALSEAPVALAVAADGTLYLAMQHHLEVYSPQGKRLARWQRPPGRPWFTSVALAPGRVWVGDAGNRQVLGYDRQGRLVARLGRRDPGRGVPGILAPSPHLDVAVGAGGQLWVANPGRHRVEAYTAKGTVARWWGKPSQAADGFCGCCNPTDLALLPDGRFVTAEKGLPRVKLYTRAGRLQGVLAGPERFVKERASFDLAVDHRGRIVVLERATGLVRVFATKKEQTNE
ncbi:MAG: hypothetical protein GX774_15310 [Armatimonadetes bacterium]|jgi:hypothetical protein|nr:hypothetical protein [Armatimonadota bacterium]